MSRKLFSIFILLSLNIHSQEFLIRRPDCKIGVHENLEKDKPNLYENLIELLEEKGYEHYTIKHEQKFLPKELYLSLEQEMLGDGWFPDCLVKIIIKEIKDDIRKESDETFFKKELKRKFPRIFWSGSYRCKLALRDIFVHLPYCRIQ